MDGTAKVVKGTQRNRYWTLNGLASRSLPRRGLNRAGPFTNVCCHPKSGLDELNLRAAIWRPFH